MKLEEFLAELKACPDESLRELGVMNNFAIFLGAELETFREEITKRFEYTPAPFDKQYSFYNTNNLIYIHFSNSAGKGQLNCPLSCDNLANAEEGNKHFNKQRQNYKSSITLHPESVVNDHLYRRSISDVIFQLGLFAIEKSIPLCMPPRGLATFEVRNNKFFYDFSKIVYYEPNIV